MRATLLLTVVVLMLTTASERPMVATVPASLAAVVNASALDDDLFAAQFCGATLVAPSLALTANHCVEDRRPGSVDVVVAVWDLCGGSGIRRHVVEVVPHSEAGADRAVDAALLVLDHPIAGVTPADLASPGAESQAVGWGRLSSGGVPTCQPTTVPLDPAPVEMCSAVATRWNRDYQPSRHLCARPGPGAQRNTCQGDSGGPVYDERDRLVAVITWGPDCDLSSVGVYHRVDDLKSWISSQSSQSLE